MTNLPEQFESWVLPEGVDKLTYEPDTKLDNCGTFKLEREDHTIANLLRMQLLRDPLVIFVGYKHPHPIVHHIELRIQTVSSQKAGMTRYTPHDALIAALRDLSTELSTLEELVDPIFQKEEDERDKERPFHSEVGKRMPS